jgi:uncharacterized protein (UPF0332 family)
MLLLLTMVSEQHIQQLKTSADAVYQLEDYTSATILYFKTLFALQDYKLLLKGRAPKDHTERFQLLKKHYPQSYTTLDKEFNTYRNTYNRVIDKETCQRIKREVEHELSTLHKN